MINTDPYITAGKMNPIIAELEPGDCFCTRNPMWLGRAICATERLWAKDNKAKYSHAGVIIGRGGITFEALWTNKRQNLWKAYQGTEIFIARHEDMTLENFWKGWDGIKKYEGNMYAGHRLLLHLIPFISKIGTGGFAVCSEIVGKFWQKSIYPDFYWKGRNPDDISDIMHNYKGWKTLYEDKL
uniref:Peptidase n=1 Tax=viral metagenome TaxID=1070528 RepID=A0A6M3JNR1_9ZZZZ